MAENKHDKVIRDHIQEALLTSNDWAELVGFAYDQDHGLIAEVYTEDPEATVEVLATYKLGITLSLLPKDSNG